ncbi:HD-GYP domain-containing protein [Oceanithermus profundus]|uniref:HD-GYP domain-containing protein n=1 Tax=Oceanithermus profundus TaxID=187137 RepID=UPI0003074379
MFWGALFAWAQFAEVKLLAYASFSHLFIFVLAAIIIFPPWVVPLLIFLFYINPSIFNLTKEDFSYTWYKDFFNRLQSLLAAAGAAFVFTFIYNNIPIYISDVNITQMVAIILASIANFIINISLVSLAVHISTRMPIKDIWFHNFGWIVFSYMLMTPVSLLLARLYNANPPLLGNWGGWAVILFLIPLYYARFHWDEVVKLREAFNKTVDLLSNTIDAKDSHTFLHSERVTAIASALARAYGLDAAQVNTIEKGSRIHDIGKIGIPDAVLFKPGSLTEEEYNIIKKHPEYGVRLLEPASEYLSETFDIIKYHHERWDGRGYPEGLAGQEIPLWARIVGLADAYEAMTAGRPYQKAKTPEDALREIEDLAGIQFDPKLVRLFREIWETNPAWRDREVFLRLYSSKVPSLESSSPPSLEREPETSQKSS